MIKIFTIIILFFLDLISKKLIFHYIDLNTFQFLMFFVDIAHIHNYGVSFGLFSGLMGFQAQEIVLIAQMKIRFPFYPTLKFLEHQRFVWAEFLCVVDSIPPKPILKVSQ